MTTNKTPMFGTVVKSPPKLNPQNGDRVDLLASLPISDQLPPDPEVVPKATRRRFTAEVKLRVLREADGCTGPGEIGALLRREGIYSSLLSLWRRERSRGEIAGLTPRKRGAKPSRDPRDIENERLRRELAKVQERLRVAELICEAQKKIAQILGITPVPPENDGRTS